MSKSEPIRLALIITVGIVIGHAVGATILDAGLIGSIIGGFVAWRLRSAFATVSGSSRAGSGGIFDGGNGCNGGNGGNSGNGGNGG